MVLTMALAFAFGCARVQRGDAGTAKTSQDEETKTITQGLPPLPAGVTELKFSEFFVSPIGDRGLTITDKLRSLDGKRVRMLGYMVQEEKPTPGVFILSPYPAQIHDHDNALAESLPPSAVHVSVPTGRDQPVPHSTRLLLLTGTLSVGNRTEADGRISMVRLAADASSKQGEHIFKTLRSKTKNISSSKGHNHE